MDESPMFRDGAMHAMKVSREFEFVDRAPGEVSMPGTLVFDQTNIKLSFSASRFSGMEKRATYLFKTATTANYLLHPRQLRLSDDGWRELEVEYIEDDPVDTTDVADVRDLEPLSVEEVREEIIDALIMQGAECALYTKLSNTFSLIEGDIESVYEKGVLVDGRPYDLNSTVPSIDEDDTATYHTTASGDQLYIPPFAIPETVPDDSDGRVDIGDQIKIRDQFNEIIRELGLDEEAGENDLLPFGDKVRDMLFVVECLRSKRIPHI